MKASPSLGLCMIVKNEEKNLPQLFDSVIGCFDEIHITDTGSTDGTLEWLKKPETAERVGCPVFIHYFKWVNDFAQARNASFEPCKTDFTMWMDADDALKNKDNFIAWKNTAMQFSDCFLADYNYAVDKDRNPLIRFARERVFRTALKPKWQYPIHEGIVMGEGWKGEIVQPSVWSIDHLRTLEDLKADKSRNLAILETIKATTGFDSRLMFYYGKELFEAQKAFEAVIAFEEAIKRTDMEMHDKVLSYQYGAYACQNCGDQIKDENKEEKFKWYQRSIDFAVKGIGIDPTRAEFYVDAGDCYLKMNDIVRALPFYSAAKNCLTPGMMGVPTPIFSFKECYGENPCLQIAKIYFNMGNIDEAERNAKECFERFGNKEAESLVQNIKDIRPLINLDNNQEDTEDIVFSCPPMQAYPFDEVLYYQKGMGGSETALIEMAMELKKITGRPVKIFNNREEDLVAPSGVEYISNKTLNLYMSKYRPKVHIAWRHNIEITKAKTYLWCHDLLTPSVERSQKFVKEICLSQFHKEYTIAKQGVPQDKIYVSRNGIVPNKFSFEKKTKDPNKIVWMSSPDRGLDRAMRVCDIVRKEYPDIKLHVYYGLENLYKYGLADRADMLKNMMEERKEWVIYHGFTEQQKMYEDVSDAIIWCHPCDFIETFCITALEMLALGIYPVTRKLGALANTLADAEENGKATMLGHDCITVGEHEAYAEAVIEAIVKQKWQSVDLDIEQHSWSKIASEWVQEMSI